MMCCVCEVLFVSEGLCVDNVNKKIPQIAEIEIAKLFSLHCITCNIALRATLHYMQHSIACNIALAELSSQLWILLKLYIQVFVDVTFTLNPLVVTLHDMLQ